MTEVATRPSRELVRADAWARGRINWSRVIVRCPSPTCTSGLALPPGFPVYACWECPTVAAIVWPPNLADIAAVLWLRPNPFTRSWEPEDTLEQLVTENIANGVGVGRDGEHLPPEGGPVLLIVNGRIVDGHPALTGPIDEARRVIAELGMAAALIPDELEG